MKDLIMYVLGTVVALFMLPIWLSSQNSADQIVSVEIASISYRISTVVAIYPAEVFTRSDAELVGLVHTNKENKVFF